jgi:heavy metal sensor kinase
MLAAQLARLRAQRKTIRVRFALWVAGLLLAALLAFGAVVYAMLARSLYGAIDDSLQLSVAQAVAAVNVENGYLTLSDSIPETSSLVRLRDRGLTIRVLNGQGQVVQAVGAYRDLPIDAASIAAAAHGQTSFATLRASSQDSAVRVVTAPVEENNAVIGVMQVAQSLGSVDDTLRRLLAALLVSIPVLVVGAMAGGYLLAARALAPIDTITTTARHISAHDLHARLHMPATDDEVGRLAATFDAMLARLDESFQRERRFTADASHELRTPLAAMQTILGVMRSQRRTPEDYEQALDDLSGETYRLRALVEDLLRLARSDTRQAGSHAPIDLSALLNDVVDIVSPLAAAKGISMTCAAPPGLMVMGDSDDLIRLMLNLCDNAVKYTVQGTIAVSAAAHADTISIEVRDTGVGIAPDHMPHLFDRFFRVDASRQSGGSGLGLAIAQEIARAHGGTITVSSAPGVGSTFTVQLPRAG